MRLHFPCWVGGLAAVALLASDRQALAAPRSDPNARLGLLNCQAGEIAKFDGTRWVCAQDEVGDSGSGSFLYDAEGKQVGTVVNVSGISQVQAAVLLAHPLSGQEITVLLSFWPDEIGIAHLLGFEFPGCTGSPWIPVSEHGFFDVFTPSLVGEDGDARPLYVPTEDSSIERITIRSELAGSQCVDRSEFPQTTDAVRAILIDSDLHETFPPPYTLELQGR